VLACLVYGDLQTPDGHGVFGPDVDDAAGSIRLRSRLWPCLEQGVRVALNGTAVHEGPWVALVCIADHDFLRVLLPGRELPLSPVGKPAPPRPAGPTS